MSATCLNCLRCVCTPVGASLRPQKGGRGAAGSSEALRLRGGGLPREGGEGCSFIRCCCRLIAHASSSSHDSVPEDVHLSRPHEHEHYSSRSGVPSAEEEEAGGVREAEREGGPKHQHQRLLDTLTRLCVCVCATRRAIRRTSLAAARRGLRARTGPARGQPQPAGGGSVTARRRGEEGERRGAAGGRALSDVSRARLGRVASCLVSFPPPASRGSRRRAAAGTCPSPGSGSLPFQSLMLISHRRRKACPSARSWRPKKARTVAGEALSPPSPPWK